MWEMTVKYGSGGLGEAFQSPAHITVMPGEAMAMGNPVSQGALRRTMTMGSYQTVYGDARGCGPGKITLGDV